MSKTTILLVDDNPQYLELIGIHLRKWDFNVIEAESAKEGLRILSEQEIDLIVSDREMPEMDGITFLKEVRKEYEELPFILITAFGNIDDAIDVVKLGAADYMLKPCNFDDLNLKINRLLKMFQLTKENNDLRDYLKGHFRFQNLITRSPEMKKALKIAKKISPIPNATIAIFGESGTGKEVLARAIHTEGKGNSKNFVVVNCASIPSELLESELFGHVKGAFTGADQNRQGKFAAANKGTLMLDEIGDMPIVLQAKLLRVLQEKTYEMVGDNETHSIDCRVIVATHRKLPDLIKKGAFREDLYHRINTFPITLPSLRERIEDIPLLLDSILEKVSDELGFDEMAVTQGTRKALMELPWSGNIRELINVLKRAAILTDKNIILPQHLSCDETVSQFSSTGNGEGNSSPYTIHLREHSSLDSIIDSVLDKTLELCNNNKTKAAHTLKIGRKMFNRRNVGK